MDSGEGKFVNPKVKSLAGIEQLEEEYPDHGGWFSTGETVHIKNYRFIIKKVNPTELIVKISPDDALKIQGRRHSKDEWFKVGETITLRGSNFRVKSMKTGERFELRLKLLPKTKDK